MIIGSKLIFYENLPSTNTLASQLLNGEEQQEGTVIYTDYQSAGKGQQGSSWESCKGKNLLFSIILSPFSIIPEDQFILSMAISLGICDFLDHNLEEIKIKWPNDIYVKDDKIAGILIENSILGNTLKSSIAGIGLNINQESFSDTIPNGVSMKMIRGKEYDLELCFKEVLLQLDQRYKQLLYGDRNIIRAEYLARLYKLNEWHLFRKEGSEFKGRIINVLPTGKLKIEEETGRKVEFSFREVEYVK